MCKCVCVCERGTLLTYSNVNMSFVYLKHNFNQMQFSNHIPTEFCSGNVMQNSNE